jgi:hypothetical protein
MRILQLDRKMILSDKVTYDVYSIKTRIIDNLNAQHFRTDTKDDAIAFRLVGLITSSGSQNSRYRVLSILKEGSISLDKQPGSFIVKWTVHLGSLYFIALCFSIFSGVFTLSILGSNTITSLSVVCIFFLLFVLFGILFLNSRLKGIIFKSVYYYQH